MPIYEYICPSCHHKFERLINKDWGSLPCEKCGAQAVKVISLSTFVVNGYNAKNGYSKEQKNDSNI